MIIFMETVLNQIMTFIKEVSNSFSPISPARRDSNPLFIILFKQEVIEEHQIQLA